MEKTQVLTNLVFYREATNALKKQIESVAMWAKLQRGDYYFHEGDSCSNIAIVTAGRIRVFKTGENGRSITLYHVEPRETCILTTFCLLSQHQYPATAQAELDTTAVVFPASIFRDWMNDFAVVRSFVFATMTERVSAMMALIEEITFKKLDHRLAEFIIAGAANGKSILCITHEEIAMQIGSAREVVSRVLKEFERQDAVELLRGKIVIKNLGLLRKFLKSDRF